MARLAVVMSVLGVLAACSSQISTPPWDQSPDFNDCWNMFPPGPNFQKQIEEYMGTKDRNVTVLGCVPEYRLNEVTCHSFKKVGPGEWPGPVTDWCEKYFGVTLEKTK
jgi:hypothetical protein